jgi:predicted RNase H-like HicB family nuclease
VIERHLRRYTVVLEWDPEAPGYSVVVPALPGCTSQGQTVEEALSTAAQAVALHIACMEEDGECVPDDSGVIVASVAA